MLRFYWSLIREMPAAFRNSDEAWAFWIWTIGTPLAALFNPELQKWMNTPQFARWFFVVPVAVSVVYGLLRANYVRFGEVSERQRAFRMAGLPREAVEQQRSFEKVVKAS